MYRTEEELRRYTTLSLKKYPLKANAALSFPYTKERRAAYSPLVASTPPYKKAEGN
jgi:hypothetical protein